MTHPRTQLLFVLLSIADLGTTCWLLASQDGQVYEANPLAQLWFDRGGWAGLAAFKLVGVGVVLALAGLIARAHVLAARRVLRLGSAVLALTVLYSLGLPAFARYRERCSDREFDQEIARANLEARDFHHRHIAFEALMNRVVRDLMAGDSTLRQAAAVVADSDRARDPVWRKGVLATGRGRQMPAVFAACALAHVVRTLHTDPRADWRAGARLEREYHRTFGHPSPHAHHFEAWEVGPEEQEAVVAVQPIR